MNPGVEHSDQRLVHSKVKPLEYEEARLHHPELHAELGAAVVVQLVFVENDLVKEQDLLLNLQLVIVNFYVCRLYFEMLAAASCKEETSYGATLDWVPLYCVVKVQSKGWTMLLR